MKVVQLRVGERENVKVIMEEKFDIFVYSFGRNASQIDILLMNASDFR